MESITLRLAICSTLWLAMTSQLFVDGVRGDEPVDYAKQIKPLLATHCYSCHGALKQAGGLRLDTVNFALTGGDSGPALISADPEKSSLLERVSSHDPAAQMPPEGKRLADQQIDLLRKWIAGGVEAQADEQPQSDPLSHWAFVPPRQSLPSNGTRSVPKTVNSIAEN